MLHYLFEAKLICIDVLYYVKISVHSVIVVFVIITYSLKKIGRLIGIGFFWSSNNRYRY